MSSSDSPVPAFTQGLVLRPPSSADPRLVAVDCAATYSAPGLVGSGMMRTGPVGGMLPGSGTDTGGWLYATGAGAPGPQGNVFPPFKPLGLIDTNFIFLSGAPGPTVELTQDQYANGTAAFGPDGAVPVSPFMAAPSSDPAKTAVHIPGSSAHDAGCLPNDIAGDPFGPGTCLLTQPASFAGRVPYQGYDVVTTVNGITGPPARLANVQCAVREGGVVEATKTYTTTGGGKLSLFDADSVKRQRTALLWGSAGDKPYSPATSAFQPRPPFAGLSVLPPTMQGIAVKDPTNAAPSRVYELTAAQYGAFCQSTQSCAFPDGTSAAKTAALKDGSYLAWT